MVRSFSIKALLAFGVVSVVATTAAAQDPEAGDTGAWQQGNPQQGGQWQGQQQQGQGWGQPPPNQQQGWNNGQAPRAGAAEERPGRVNTDDDAAAGETDHALAVGHVGFTWFGFNALDLGNSGNTLAASAPAIGVRYWLADGLGLDLGLGFGFQTGGGTIDTPTVTTDTSDPSWFALTIHAGVPVALYAGKHYTFLVIPEIDFAFGSGTIYGPTPNLDQNVGGLRLNVGARVGAEVHFGFIGIPELSLQATLGLNIAYSSTTLENDLSNPQGSTITSAHTLGLGTTNNGNEKPWDILVGGLRATYYWE